MCQFSLQEGLFLSYRGGLSPVNLRITVARGPVPRERWCARTIRAPSVVCDRLITNGSGAGAPELQRGRGLVRGTLARDRPSPYGEGGGVFYRSAGACPPRSLDCASNSHPSVVRERLLPNGSRSGDLDLQRGGGSGARNAGGGQAPALRYKRPVPRDRNHKGPTSSTVP